MGSHKFKLGQLAVVSFGLVEIAVIIRSTQTKQSKKGEEYYYQVETSENIFQVIAEKDLLGVNIKKDTQGMWIEWEADRRLLPEDAKFFQAHQGYHPAGYSFAGHRITDEKTNWKCYASS